MATEDDFQPVAGKHAQFFDIAADEAGNVYTSGYCNDAAGVQYDVIRMKQASQSGERDTLGRS